MTAAQLKVWREDRARQAAQHPGPAVRARGDHYRKKNNGVALRTYRWIVMFVLVCVVAGCGRLATIDRYDVAAESVMAGALAVDGVQSARAERWCVEANPLLGNCGGGVSIPVYFAGIAVLHAVAVVLLPPGRWRAAFQAAALGVEGATVYRNRQRERELPYLTH